MRPEYGLFRGCQKHQILPDHFWANLRRLLEIFLKKLSWLQWFLVSKKGIRKLSPWLLFTWQFAVFGRHNLVDYEIETRHFGNFRTMASLRDCICSTSQFVLPRRFAFLGQFRLIQIQMILKWSWYNFLTKNEEKYSKNENKKYEIIENLDHEFDEMKRKYSRWMLIAWKYLTTCDNFRKNFITVYYYE